MKTETQLQKFSTASIFQVLTWEQAHQLMEVPNLERRIKRDLSDAIRSAYDRNDKSQIMFLLHRQTDQGGKSCCEVISTSEVSGLFTQVVSGRDIPRDDRDIYLSALMDEHGFISIWSMDRWPVVTPEDFNEVHPYQNATHIAYENSILVPLEGTKWIDIYRACNKAIKENEPTDHIFIERLTVSETNPNHIELLTGS